MIRQELVLDTPYLNAAGSLGFAPPAAWALPERIGAFVTNPVSATRRTPAAERTALPYPGGVLLHTGLPNPGLNAVLRQYAQRWARSTAPVWVHLMPQTPAQAREMIGRLEGTEGVMTIELGLPPECSAEEALALVGAAAGELPLTVCVPLQRCGENWLNELPAGSVSAITISAPRGSLVRSGGQVVSGRLLGPGLFPLVLSALRNLLPLRLPVIAGSGVYRKADAEVLLSAGATAVQVDGVLWKGGWAQ
jgi:dihydroorotate dehydrogenase (NAD+) catalytic subunit